MFKGQASLGTEWVLSVHTKEIPMANSPNRCIDACQLKLKHSEDLATKSKAVLAKALSTWCNNRKWNILRLGSKNLWSWKNQIKFIFKSFWLDSVYQETMDESGLGVEEKQGLCEAYRLKTHFPQYYFGLYSPHKLSNFNHYPTESGEKLIKKII